VEAKSKRKLIWSWAFYDWANSAFATTVLAGFFPLFFKQYWSSGQDPIRTTLMLGTLNSIASLAVALASPGLGAIADSGAWRKRFLFAFTLLGAAGSTGLYFAQLGDWQTAAIWFVLGVIGFNGGLTFYDSLLVEVSAKNELDRVSGFGYAMGYLGGGLLFVVNVAMYLKPELFGIADGPTAIRLSFLTVGVWWLLFSLPLFLFVPEPRALKKIAWIDTVKTGFSSLLRAL
jgi:MFS transporter, UMF1 family